MGDRVDAVSNFPLCLFSSLSSFFRDPPAAYRHLPVGSPNQTIQSVPIQDYGIQSNECSNQVPLARILDPPCRHFNGACQTQRFSCERDRLISIGNRIRMGQWRWAGGGGGGRKRNQTTIGALLKTRVMDNLRWPEF